MKEEFVPPEARAEALAKARDKKMAKSSAAYVRGTTARFYNWLAGVKRGSLPEGPPIWICGDCHLGNLGPVANDDKDIKIQIRDFDQTVIGNPCHDLIRLGLSLASTARGSNLSGVVTAKLLDAILISYRGVLEGEDSPSPKPKILRRLTKKAKEADWRSLAEANIDDETPSIPLGRRFWPLSAEERREIEALVERREICELVRSASGRDDGAHVKLLDAAYWRKGCSSLGRLRYAVLLRIGAKGDGEHYCLLDLKEAANAAAPHASEVHMPNDQAERVVEGARNLSPYLGDRMRAATLLRKPIFARELMPEDLKIEIGRLEEDEAIDVASYLAGIVGAAHARQMDAATRKRWRSELRRRDAGDEAPSWLWRSVADLLADHERAYLEHCRGYWEPAERSPAAR